MAATDSYRLAVKETELAGSVPELEAIVPSRALQELARIAAAVTLDVGVHENQVVFATDGVWLTTRRIDGQFPNYRHLLPGAVRARADAAAPGAARVRPPGLGDDPARDAAAASLRGRRADRDRANARCRRVAGVDAGAYTGEMLEIGFNADFFRDGLESMDGDDIRLKLISPLRPAVLQGEGDEFTYLVMPIAFPADRRVTSSSRELPVVRAAGALAPPGPRARGRAERRRQDEPARVAARGTQGFSPRTRTDAQLIRFGAGAHGSRCVAAGTMPVEIELALEAGAGETAKLTAEPLRTAEQLRSETATLVFTPDWLGVAKGAPAMRRAYFDRVLGRLDAGPGASSPPTTAPRSRNATRRSAGPGRPLRARRALDLDGAGRCARDGARRGSPRKRWQLLAAPFAERAGELGLAEAELRYDGEPLSRDALEARLDRDLDRGVTGLGPHLDDVVLAAGPRELRSFGSQGEQRLADLALLLAEVQRYRAARLPSLPPARRRPLRARSRRAGASCGPRAESGQALITATDAAMLPAEPDQLGEATRGVRDQAAR